MEKQTSPPAHYEIPAPQEPQTYSEALGKMAVHNLNQAVFSEVKAGKLQDQGDYQQHLKDTKKDPNQYGNLRRKIGQRRGTVMTGTEAIQAGWLDNTRHRQKFNEREANDKRFRYKTELDYISGTLARLDDDRSGKLDVYMDQFAPGFLKNAKKISEAGGEAQPWARYLSDNKPAVAGQKYDGEHEGPLTNFLQWHINNVEQQQQDPEFQAMVTEWKAEYKAALAEGAKEGGWIGSKATEALKKVDEIQIFVGDVFDTIMKGTHGYHTPGTKQAVISPYVFKEKNGFTPRSLKEAKKTTFHEKGHALLQDPENDLPIMNKRWLSEALTEHSTVVLLNGKPEVIDPYSRDDGFTYVYERSLLNTVLEGGSKPIDPLIATRAHSGDQNEQRLFVKSVDEAWGQEGLLEKISSVVHLFEKNYSQDELALKRVSKSAGFDFMILPSSAAVYMTEKFLRGGALDTILEILEEKVGQEEAEAGTKVAAQQAQTIHSAPETAPKNFGTELVDALIAAGLRGKRPSHKSRAQRQDSIKKDRRPGQKLELEVKQEFAELHSDKGDQKALKGMLKRYHPDVNPGNKVAEEKAKIVSGMLDDYNKAQGSRAK